MPAGSNTDSRPLELRSGGKGPVLVRLLLSLLDWINWGMDQAAAAAAASVTPCWLGGGRGWREGERGGGGGGDFMASSCSQVIYSFQQARVRK